MSDLFICRIGTSEEDRRNLEAITQNVHFLSFLSHQKTHFTLSLYLIEIAKHTLSKGDFRKAQSPHAWLKFYQDQYQRQDKLDLLCLMSPSWASTTQLLSQAPQFSHMLDIANEAPWWTDWRALVVPQGIWLSLCLLKNKNQTNLGSKENFTSPSPWNVIPSQSYTGL